MGDRVHYRADTEDSDDQLRGGDVAGYDSSENDETKLLPRPGSISWEDSTEGSLAVKSEYSSVLAASTASKRKSNGRIPFNWSFFKAYHALDGSTERVTPFAVVLLIMLLAVYVLNQADRLVLPVVIPNGLRCGVTKEDCARSIENTTNSTANSTAAGMGENLTNRSGERDCIDFSDDEQGLLTGPAFTVIYVLAGLPLARLADTRSRPIVLLAGMIFWSVMVLLTGFAQTFWQLLLLRVFLGIGEATCNPVAYSLLADFFPANHRAFALSVYHYGVYLGGGLGWMIGAVNDVLSWRWTFHILGIAGLAIAPLVMLTLWEPAKIRKKRKERHRGKESYSIKEVFLYLVSNAPFWFLLVAGSIRNIPGYALGAWLPTFFKRNYGASDYGIPVGLVILFGGGLGSFLGGFISDRASSRWKSSKPYVIAVSQLLAAPCIAGVLLAPTAKSSYGLLFLAYLTAETWLGPAAAIVQDICMPAMRAQASAVYIGVITIVASSGPVIVPGILDAASSLDRCTSGLKIALLMVVPSFYVISSLLFFLLGLVMQWWEKRSKGKGQYLTFNADDKIVMRPH